MGHIFVKSLSQKLDFFQNQPFNISHYIFLTKIVFERNFFWIFSKKKHLKSPFTSIPHEKLGFGNLNLPKFIKCLLLYRFFRIVLQYHAIEKCHKKIPLSNELSVQTREVFSCMKLCGKAGYSIKLVSQGFLKIPKPFILLGSRAFVYLFPLDSLFVNLSGF